MVTGLFRRLSATLVFGSVSRIGKEKMIELPVYDRSGKEIEKISFDDSCLGMFVNYPLLHQAVVMYEANQRAGTHSTKTRRELICRSGKPFRQKGTGRARMGYAGRVGSRGGAVAHGPKPRDYTKEMPKKARRAALKSAILGKLRDGDFVVVDSLSMAAPKTKEAAVVLKNLNIASTCLVVTKEADKILWKSVRNLPKIEMSSLGALTTYSVLKPKQVLITKDALMAISEEYK